MAVALLATRVIALQPDPLRVCCRFLPFRVPRALTHSVPFAFPNLTCSSLCRCSGTPVFGLG